MDHRCSVNGHFFSLFVHCPTDVQRQGGGGVKISALSLRLRIYLYSPAGLQSAVLMRPWAGSRD
jgi:hypothetical protein